MLQRLKWILKLTVKGYKEESCTFYNLDNKALSLDSLGTNSDRRTTIVQLGEQMFADDSTKFSSHFHSRCPLQEEEDIFKMRNVLQ